MQNCFFVKSPEALPPTSNSLCQHIRRRHYQTMVWKQAIEPNPELPTPDTLGWQPIDGQGVPVLKGMYGDDIMPMQSWLRDTALQMAKV